jgi:hypothetical protein
MVSEHFQHLLVRTPAYLKILVELKMKKEGFAQEKSGICLHNGEFPGVIRCKVVAMPSAITWVDLGQDFSTLVAVAARMSSRRWEESSIWAGGPVGSS